MYIAVMKETIQVQTEMLRGITNKGFSFSPAIITFKNIVKTGRDIV